MATFSFLYISSWPKTCTHGNTINFIITAHYEYVSEKQLKYMNSNYIALHEKCGKIILIEKEIDRTCI